MRKVSPKLPPKPPKAKPFPRSGSVKKGSGPSNAGPRKPVSKFPVKSKLTHK